MPTFRDSIENAAKREGTKAALDSVESNKARIDADLDGNVEGSISMTRNRLTFTAYVKALLKGPQKGVTGGGRVEVDLSKKD